jgi:hypothetical protein
VSKNKYFQEVEFTPAAPPHPSKPPFPDVEAFRQAIDKFRAEVMKIKMGTSDYVKGAIQFPKDICIPATVLDRFYSKPCEETLRAFLESCQQDFGIRAARAIAEWFSEIYPKAKEMVK